MTALLPFWHMVPPLEGCHTPDNDTGTFLEHLEVRDRKELVQK